PDNACKRRFPGIRGIAPGDGVRKAGGRTADGTGRAGAIAGSVVELTGVVAGYGGRPVLQGATCRVFPGELVVITGPNGAGKTTLLRVILGLLPPISGEVRLFQQSLRSGAVRRTLRRRVGYVAQ